MDDNVEKEIVVLRRMERMLITTVGVLATIMFGVILKVVIN